VLNPPIHFECVGGLAQFTITQFVFAASGPTLSTLTATPDGMSYRVLTGAINGSSFHVEFSGAFPGPFGPVNDHYTLDGVFQTDGLWTGTFEAVFSGSGAELLGCSGQAYQGLLGIRQ